MIVDTSKAQKLGFNLDRLAYLDSFLHKAVAEGWSPAIAICVARRGEEVFSGAYGSLSPGGPPLPVDMITEVSSVTKTVVATLAMMLQEDGLLDILDPLSKFLPVFTGEGKESLSLRHLMTHTAGFLGDDDDAYTPIMAFIKTILPMGYTFDIQNQEEVALALRKVNTVLGFPEETAQRTLTDWIRLMLPLQYKPGTHFAYCSYGFRLLGMVIEQVAGTTLDLLAQEKIFGPLGMVDSHLVLPEEKWHRVLVRGASSQGSGWLNTPADLTSFAGSSGLKTTVRDLLRFGLMFYHMGTVDGVRILSPASVREMTRDQNPTVPPSTWHGKTFGSSWGLGWNIRCGKYDDMGVLRSDNAYDHGGAGGTHLLIDPASDLVVALHMVEEIAGIYHTEAVNVLYSAIDDLPA